MKIVLPVEIARLLDDASRRVRKIYVLRGLAVTVATFLAVTLVAMSVDAFCVIFDDRVRWLLSAAIWGAAALVAAFTVVRPWLRPISRRRTARVLDERHPETEERFSTLVDLAERAARADGRDNTSEGLYSVLAREGVVCANRIDLKRDFTARTILRRFYVLGAVVALLLASFVVFPNVAGLLFVRSAFPWVDVGNLYADYLEVKPGSVVALKGSPIVVTARTLKDLPGELMIRISRRDGRGWGREFAEPLASEGYRTVADMKEREWRYRVSCGPAVSRYFTVRVCEMPRYRLFTARLDYPDYTGKRPFTYTNESVGAIQAIEGTRVTFKLEIDEPGTTGELVLREGGRNRVSDSGTLDGEMVSNRVSAWSMQMTNADGFKSPAKGGPFISVPDQPPSFVIESPRAALKLPPHAKIPVEFTANDDVSLSKMILRCSMDDDPFVAMSEEEFEGHPALVRGKKDLDLSLHDLTDVRRIRFDFVVTDDYPAERGGPHAVTSTPVTVNFDVAAKNYYEQSLENQMIFMRDTMHEAENRLETAERLARDAKGEADRNKGKVVESAEKKIEQLAHEVAQAEKRAEEMAEQMEEDGRFAPVAEELRDFAENELAPVREKIEASQFASAAERVEALERVQPMLREAREMMKSAEAELNERKKKVAAYEQMRDLSDRQDALAKAAEKITSERPVETKKLDAWKTLEEAAARLAGDLNRRADSDEVESARRKMELAAARMQELKDDIALEADKNLKDEQRAERRKAAAARVEKARTDAMKSALAEAKRAEEMLAKARERAEIAERTMDLNERAQRVRESEAAANQARDAARKAEAALVRAEAPDELRDAEEKVLGDIRDAREASADRADELKRAYDRQKAVRLALESEQPLKDFAAADRKSAAEDRARREAALAELAKAEKAAAEALTALRRQENEEAVKKQAAAEAALAEAREKLPANGLDAAERSLNEAKKAGEQAKAIPNNDGIQRNALDRQRTALRDIRAAADALAEAQGAKMDERRELRRAQKTAERIAAAQAAAERAGERAEEQLARNDFNGAAQQQHAADNQADRALGLIEAQKARFERMDRDDVAEALGKAAEAQEKAIEAESAAEAARAVAAKIPQNAKEKREAAAKEAVEAQKAATEAQRAAEQALAQAMESVGVTVESGAPAAEAESARQADGKAEATASELAREAADEIRDAVAAEAAELGIAEESDGETASADGEKGEKGEKAENDEDSKEQGGGKGKKPSKLKKRDENSRSLGGGGAKMDEVMKELEDELRKNQAPKDVLDSVSKKSWYRIRGTVKEGLGDGALKDVPPEYRDLVRRYFMRLVEEGSVQK